MLREHIPGLQHAITGTLRINTDCDCPAERVVSLAAEYYGKTFDMYCFVPSRLMPEADAANGSHVLLSGQIRTDNNGYPSMIDVERIEILEEESDLPDHMDVMGILKE